MAAGVKTVAVVPAKSLAAAKSRLAPVLDEQQRAEVSLEMLRAVLEQLRQLPDFSAYAVLSSDERALDLARQLGASALEERQGSLNRALYLGRAWALGADAGALLVVLSDLPLVQAGDLAELLRIDADVVIAPSKDGGTNALLLRPPEAIPFRFGRASARHHQLEAQKRGLRVSLLERERLAFDVDTPQDLEAIRIPNAV
ncbi:MAG TPA: 2-phospho-L-lactate guanylyltransferase [Chloroflexota bacterium]|nr:2-phospho-L-lactate guanylyltransferase [Chloroflexota bacterium]